jgi:hypothetical protein
MKVPADLITARAPKELSCSKTQVAKHLKNKVPLKNIRPAKKSRTVKKTSFIVKHNDLAKVTSFIIYVNGLETFRFINLFIIK